MRTVLLGVMLLLMATATHAAEHPLQAPRVLTLNLTTRAGYTQTLRLNIYDKRLADVVERRLVGRRLGYADFVIRRAQVDVQNYGNGGEWTDYAMMIRIGGLFDFICAVFGAGVQITGGTNIWIDAANALCIATAIVTGGEAIGRQIYTAYEKSVIDGRAWYWYSLLGTCPGVGGIC